MVSQLTRAGNSVASNIAEGTSRITGKEQARFSEISYSSLMETLNHLIISQKQNYISQDELVIGRSYIDEIANKLNSLRKSQLKRK